MVWLVRSCYIDLNRPCLFYELPLLQWNKNPNQLLVSIMGSSRWTQSTSILFILVKPTYILFTVYIYQILDLIHNFCPILEWTNFKTSAAPRCGNSSKSRWINFSSSHLSVKHGWTMLNMFKWRNHSWFKDITTMQNWHSCAVQGLYDSLCTIMHTTSKNTLYGDVTHPELQSETDSSRIWGKSLASALYVLHSTLYTLHSTLLYTVHFALYILHSALYTLHSTFHPHFTLYVSHSTLYTLHVTHHTLNFTLHTLHFKYIILCTSLHSTLCALHSAVYPHFTLYAWHSTLYTLRFTLHTPHFTFYAPHFTIKILCALHFTLHTPHFTLYTPHFTLYILHSTLSTPHSTLYTLHFTL